MTAGRISKQMDRV